MVALEADIGDACAQALSNFEEDDAGVFEFVEVDAHAGEVEALVAVEVLDGAGSPVELELVDGRAGQKVDLPGDAHGVDASVPGDLDVCDDGLALKSEGDVDRAVVLEIEHVLDAGEAAQAVQAGDVVCDDLLAVLAGALAGADLVADELSRGGVGGEVFV